MSSHREAPEISKDPVADSSDLYAFVSPDRPEMVTLIANYVPLQAPDGGPNFYEFGDEVQYALHIDNNADGDADISLYFDFTSEITDPNTFLYNTGPITSLTSPSWNRRQTYSVTWVDRTGSTVLGSGIPCPPCNIGPLSTPDYPSLVAEAITELPRNTTVLAGQRAEGFYVDLGAVFDLGDLRPFEQDHNTFGLANTGLGHMAKGVNSTAGVNVHSIAIQIPINELTANSRIPGSVTDPHAVLGVWTTASRQKARILGGQSGATIASGPFTQVSRLGNPLVNEVLIPLAAKDYWNRQAPGEDQQFASYVANPELAGLLPVLYPGVFPLLAQQVSSGAPRADLLAILLTGIPSGVVPGFQNYTGPRQADMLRLNVAIPPTKNGASNLGLIGGDPAGFPNGRRVFDDVVTIELRAIAGVTLPLVDPSYTPDAAAGAISMGLTSGPSDLTALGTANYHPTFPYLGTPHSGFAVPASSN